MLVCLNFMARSFFARSADAESYLLLFWAHLDDFEIVLSARLKMDWLAVSIDCFGVVAQALDSFRNLDE